MISGQITDDSGQPEKDVVVSLLHKGGEKKTIKTDGSGRYEVLFHLHNENLGEEIVVSVGDAQKVIAIEFDPDDKFTNRGHVVDFGAPVQDGMLSWVYLSGASLLVISVVFCVGFLKKGKRLKGLERKSPFVKRGKRKSSL